MSAVRKSISIPEELWARAETRRIALRYPSMSAYLQELIYQDIASGDAHIREAGSSHVLNEPPPGKGVPGAVSLKKDAAEKIVEAVQRAARGSKPK